MKKKNYFLILIAIFSLLWLAAGCPGKEPVTTEAALVRGVQTPVPAPVLAPTPVPTPQPTATPRRYGALLSVELEGILAPGEIEDFVGPLYAGVGVPAARYDVAVYWIEYESLYPDGEIAPITAQVFIPRYQDVARRSVYVFGPGSTGLRDSCRPSREHIAGIRWGLYRAHVLSHAGRGSIGVMPDYMGFGDPSHLQYYMVAECEARVMLDAFRAVEALLAETAAFGVTDMTHFVAGFSQGGHAAFAAADYRAAYAPDIPLHGVIGYGPTTNLFALLREYPDVAPMVLYTYRNLYGEERCDPDLVLQEKFAVTLDKDIIRMCVGAMQSYYPIDPVKLFTPAFARALLAGTLETAFPSIYSLIDANNTGLAGHGVPALILQGRDDIVVYPSSQEDFVTRLRAAGCEVDYIFLENSRHDTRQLGFEQTRAWIDGKTNAAAEGVNG